MKESLQKTSRSRGEQRMGLEGSHAARGGKRKLLLIPGSRLEGLKADETIPAKERASAALLCGELGE